MFYVEQQVLGGSWQRLSYHTVGQDALYQMSPIYSANTLQLNPMRVIDDDGKVYATKTFAASVVTLLPTPLPQLIDPILRKVF